MLHATPPRASVPSVGPLAHALSFSFPVFEYIGQCRHAAEAKMGRRGRRIVHQHLDRVVVEHIRDGVRAALQQDEGPAAIPADLATVYIVTTFILVLNWWVESKSRLSAREVDDVFLALVVPALTPSAGRSSKR